MANRKSILTTDQIYHVYNRGVDKRDIFTNESDYYRFIHYLYEFNDTAPAVHPREKQRGRTSSDRKRDILVEIICYCLTPNHFHLVLRQVKDNGITLFMKKISTGYAMYFNEKYERSEALFQVRFKDVHVENNYCLLHLSRYIHINPIGLFRKEDNGDKKLITDEAQKYLKSFRFSSYLDFIGKKNFPSLIIPNIITDQFKSGEYEKFVEEYVFDKEEQLIGLTLE